MSTDPLDIVRAILAAPTDLDTVSRLVAEDATYVSLNYDNPELKRLMPWCGTGHGPKGIVETFVKVGRFWKVESFELLDVFGSGENVAVFGRFTYTSRKIGRTVTTPFAIWAKVSNGKLTYMQFMEDTFATGMSFRTRGVWHFESDPDGGEVTVGAEDA
ncbi:MAG: nuclear transport factor 2 family protein [Janthinobacterium lividum]